MATIEKCSRARDPRLARLSRRSRRRSRSRAARVGSGGGAVGRVDRRARGGRAARRRRSALRRQGRAAAVGNVNDVLAPGAARPRRGRPGGGRREADRARRHARTRAASAPTRSSACRSPRRAPPRRPPRRPLYRALGGDAATLLPVPLMNVINGGRHADNPLDFQEFMIVPHGAPSFPEAIRQGVEVYHALRELLDAARPHHRGRRRRRLRARRSARTRRRSTCSSRRSRRRASRPGRDVSLALDVAASELVDGDGYVFRKSGGARRTADELIALYERWCAPIRSSRSRTASARTTGPAGSASRRALGARVQLVGDDVFVTNEKILARGIAEEVGNAILIKVNQIGTLTETRAAMTRAAAAELPLDRLASLGRDRGRLHRRPRGRDRRRADQDGRAVPLGADREVQPAPRDRRGAGHARALRRSVPPAGPAAGGWRRAAGAVVPYQTWARSPRSCSIVGEVAAAGHQEDGRVAPRRDRGRASRSSVQTGGVPR